MADLKSCPFCGGEAETRKEMGGTTWKVKCTKCSAEVGRYWFGRKKQAVIAWNTRKPMEAVVAELEKHMEASEKEYEKHIYIGALGEMRAYETAISIVRGKDKCSTCQYSSGHVSTCMLKSSVCYHERRIVRGKE